MNELLLVISLVFIFGATLLGYKISGARGFTP